MQDKAEEGRLSPKGDFLLTLGIYQFFHEVLLYHLVPVCESHNFQSVKTCEVLSTLRWLIKCEQ